MLPTHCFRFGTCLLALLMGLSLAFSGCSSPSQTSEPPSTEGDGSVSLSLLYTLSDRGLVLREVGTDTTRTLVQNASSTGRRSLSPSGTYLAFTYSTADSTHLAVLDRNRRSLHRIDARPGTVTYSLSWQPKSDTLAFAYYAPGPSGGRGPGDVFVTGPTGSARNVGCSAAREVLGWRPDGSLATRNDETLYVVSPVDCGTRASADVERMEAAAYAPTGDHLAYYQTELTYDKDAHEYTPDTSLFLSNGRGTSPESLFGPDRRPRHLQWSPNGSELAFSVRVSANDQRQISIYNVRSDRTVYLSPPGKTSANQTHPRWSPSGTHIAFTRRDGAQEEAAVRIEGQTRRLAPVNDAVWGWIDDRTVVIPGPDSLRVQSVGGQTQYAQPVPATLIHAWRSSPA